MYEDLTVVISCSGTSTRLGMSTTKSLFDICGKPLIIRQHELLKDIKDIRIVIGFESEKVIDLVTLYRKNVMFIFNNDHKNTGIGAKLYKSVIGSNKYVLIVDGNLVIHPSDMKKVLDYPRNVICGTKVLSDNLIMVNFVGDKAANFFETDNVIEWVGIAIIESEDILPGRGLMYQMFSSLLFIDYLGIRAINIDTFSDYENAITWINRNYQ